MIFYKFKCTTNGDDSYTIKRKTFEERIACRNSGTSINPEGIKCEKFCRDNIKEKLNFFICDMNENVISIVAIYQGELKDIDIVDARLNELILYLDLDFLIAQKEEITLGDIIYELETSADNKYIHNHRDIRNKFDLFLPNRWIHETKLTKNTKTQEELKEDCKKLVVEDVLSQEVDRIFSPQQDKKFGVPAHYLLNIQDESDCVQVVEILLNSLRQNNRMVREVYARIELNRVYSLENISSQDLKKLYELNKGGVVIIYSYLEVVEDDFYSTERNVMNMLTSIIGQYSTEVTTILCCCGKSKSQVNLYQNGLTDLLFIEIADTVLYNEKAVDYLEKMATSLSVANTNGLKELVEADLAYKPLDLKTLFRKWHKNYVKLVQFPQYADFIGKEYKHKIDEKNFAYDDLNKLIGLNSVKEVVNNYLNYALFQKACKEQGIKVHNTCRHMCFVGNPGTAKTTVARIIAKVMKENGLLSKGDLIEVGRSDIVSRFVGGTAPNVKELFKQAEGNVLFIDEAYSLYDGKEGLYGDEAINAIVQEMENKRDDLVVIFAGYKKEMQNFLDKNSGLRSRIAYDIEFEDYSEAELFEIAKKQANDFEMNINECEEKIKNIIKLGKNSKNFGNGRFIRSMLEKARMKQATRLVNEDKMFGENLNILKPEDFELPKVEEKIIMGFN